jgi:3-oxoacyl-[acyl-carrier protein] reductase
MADLQGKVALVTGASQGIGRACALELAKAGATVALAARNEVKLAEVAAQIAAAGGQAAAFVLDIASEESIKAGAKSILDRFGKVEILVNNAGITRDGLMMRMKRADWDDVLGTNLTGAFLLTQALLPAMLRNRWGRIINITSVVGRTGQAGQVNYAASKAGLIGFTRSLAREVSSRNVTVNAVAPGYIETPMTAVLDEKQREVMMVQIPLGRAGTDVEIAQSVAFLASHGAAYVHGRIGESNVLSDMSRQNECVILRTRALGAKDLVFTLLQSSRIWVPRSASETRASLLNSQPLFHTAHAIPRYGELRVRGVLQRENNFAGEPRIHFVHPIDIDECATMDAQKLRGVETVLKLYDGLIHAMAAAVHYRVGQLVLRDEMGHVIERQKRDALSNPRCNTVRMAGLFELK